MSEKIIVALTGQSGSGKSSLGRYFAGQGYTVIDCDKVAAEVHSDKECQNALRSAFGDDAVKNGVVDKSVLSQKAFSSPENLKKLTDITHPFIIKNILATIDEAVQSGEKLVIVDGAVIIGHDFEKYCDKFIVVTCDKEKQYRRLMARDNITLEKAQNRIAKQTPLEVMLGKADFVV